MWLQRTSSSQRRMNTITNEHGKMTRLFAPSHVQRLTRDFHHSCLYCLYILLHTTDTWRQGPGCLGSDWHAGRRRRPYNCTIRSAPDSPSGCRRSCQYFWALCLRGLHTIIIDVVPNMMLPTIHSPIFRRKASQSARVLPAVLEKDRRCESYCWRLSFP